MKKTLLTTLVVLGALPAFAHGRHHGKFYPTRPSNLVPTAAGCSNAGDETARPIYEERGGRWVFVGYECVQDNRGGGGG